MNAAMVASELEARNQLDSAPQFDSTVQGVDPPSAMGLVGEDKRDAPPRGSPPARIPGSGETGAVDAPGKGLPEAPDSYVQTGNTKLVGIMDVELYDCNPSPPGVFISV